MHGTNEFLGKDNTSPKLESELESVPTARGKEHTLSHLSGFLGKDTPPDADQASGTNVHSPGILRAEQVQGRPEDTGTIHS